jgi:hypothetical protein
MVGENLRWRSYGLLLLGRHEELSLCIEELRRIRTLPCVAGEVFQLSDVFALRAAWQLRRECDADALADALEAVKRMAGIQNTFHDVLLERIVLADVFLRLLEKKASHGRVAISADLGLVRAAARKACRGLERFSHNFPLGLPYAHLAQGRLERLTGHARKAEVRFRRALAESERLRTRWAEGLACYEMGRSMPASLKGQQFLKRADSIFSDIGTTYERTLTDKLADCL